MIFVTLGTHQQPFGRLIDALSALPSGELVVQHGHSPGPRSARVAIPFLPFSEVLEHIDAAETVITHAGVGSILCATRAGHTPIVVPRLKRHGEHVDDHQLELTAALAERDMVIAAQDLGELAETVRRAPPRRPEPIEPPRPLHDALRAAILGQADRVLPTRL